MMLPVFLWPRKKPSKAKRFAKNEVVSKVTEVSRLAKHVMESKAKRM